MAKTNHSNFWLDEDLFDEDNDLLVNEDQAKIRQLIRLASVRRSIANFVSIVSGQNIPVHFSGGDESYTSGEVVVIAGSDNPNHFDYMVGLALHEGAHVLLSDFDYLKFIAEKYNYIRNGAVGAYDDVRPRFHPAIQAHLPEKFQKDEYGNSLEFANEYSDMVARMIDDIKVIMNVIEDRRIDKYVYSRAPGYRGYYDAMYRKYFYTPTVAKNLKYDPSFREMTVDAYINRILLMFHPDNDLDVLPGLRSIVNMIDFDNIDRVSPDNDPETIYQGGQIAPAWKYSSDFDNQPALWKLSNEIYAQIIKHVGVKNPSLFRDTFIPDDFIKSLMDDLDGLRGDSQEDSEEDSDEHSLSNLPDLDGGISFNSDSEDDASGGAGDEDEEEERVDTRDSMEPKPAPEGKYNPDSGKSQIEKAKRVLEGDAPKKDVSQKRQDTIQSISDSGTTVEEVVVTTDGMNPRKVDVIVTNDISQGFMDSDAFVFAGDAWGRIANEDSVAKGRRMGAILASRLQVRHDPLVTHRTRLDRGKIDRRLLANLGTGLTNVFKRTTVESFKPAMLHLSIDASGSMGGNKWKKVISVATALAYVSTEVRNIDVTISLRGTNWNDIFNSFIFDSRIHTFSQWKRVGRQIHPSGSTPESLCFKAVLDRMISDRATHNVYFINFSDGAPGTGASDVRYYGEVAMDHTRQTINEIKGYGINILSYFIDGSSSMYGSDNSSLEENFKRMYGPTAEFVNVESATKVLTTLNKVLAER